jgi:hypothetical protein
MTTPTDNPNSVMDFLIRSQVVQQAGFSFQQAYGSFSSTQTQSIATAPSRTALTYDTTDLAGGGMILSGSTPTPFINIPLGGTYRVITSVQLNRSGGGNADTYVWFSVDGTPVPNTATKTHLGSATESVMTVEVLLPLFAGQRVSVETNAQGSGNEALAEVASPPQPAVPSIITIVQRIA